MNFVAVVEGQNRIKMAASKADSRPPGVGRVRGYFLSEYGSESRPSTAMVVPTAANAAG
jgi:hypothetical protein